ncbi:MAG: molybdenum cofactor biosynthesis protein MoaE [Ilumatobacteraceae bacterium]|nr:molybdenum cofactor biosynthesis protein MoaE [Ilumatobacteraceae bacterium]
MQVTSINNNWCAISSELLPISEAYEWAILPNCGAVVLFSGIVRDHADGRDEVTALTYEAFEAEVVKKFDDIVTELRKRWSAVGRVALLHRLGTLSLGESSVLAVVSAPHRDMAFEAARFAIDALKESAPIWKKEHWKGGSDWGTGAHHVVAPENVKPPQSTNSTPVVDGTHS